MKTKRLAGHIGIFNDSREDSSNWKQGTYGILPRTDREGKKVMQNEGITPEIDENKGPAWSFLGITPEVHQNKGTYLAEPEKS